jgi:TonB family protein
MDTVIEPRQNSEPELRLLADLGTAGTSVRWREAAIASVAAHIALLILLASLPNGVFQPPPKRIAEARKVTPLVAPPFELTQPNPNKGKISKSVNIESLMPHPSIQLPRSAPSTTRPAAQTPAPPTPFVAPPAPTPKVAPAPQLSEPPKLETAANEGALTKAPLGNPQAPPAPPQIQAEEKPKLAFETPGAVTSSPRQGTGKIAVPGSSVSEAIRSMPRGGSGGLTVGDSGTGIGGVGEGLNLPPAPGKIGSNLELLSDPQGVDFRPYMLKVLAAVRRNWFAIMPESAKLGSRGKVALQFSIDRQGSVPKLVIVMPSGIQALDRAAVAGVSASNPFPPLPAEFHGNLIRLQLMFAYNTPTN